MIRLLYFLLFLMTTHCGYAQYRSSVFQMDADERFKSINVNQDISADTLIEFHELTNVSSVYISGEVSLGDINQGFVRVTIKDDYNMEYLVYEVFPVLADSVIIPIQRIGMESKSLDNVTIQSMRVEVSDAQFRLDSIFYVDVSRQGTGTGGLSVNIRKEQNNYIINKLNANLRRKGLLWEAGTTSVSEMTYDEKKSLFGGKVPNLGGLEYYVGGIFVMPKSIGASNKDMHPVRSTSNSYVSEWDWRNRHSRNWMTPVRDQGICGSCWAFSAVGTLEAYINLYYNRKIDFDLSEQEIVSCSTDSGCSGDVEYTAFSYIKNHGIVEEECFPYQKSEVNCNYKCNNPTERVYIDSLPSYISKPSEAVIKRSLFKAPLCLSILSWHHGVVLLGYKTLAVGDTISGQTMLKHVITASDSMYIGRTAWLLKNSWGYNWGNKGYGYIIEDTDSMGFYSLRGKILCQNYDVDDIICDDADGDGYYFWGVGPKPTNCPAGVPDAPDGDDWDRSKGPIDEFGNLTELETQQNPTVYISQDTVWNNRKHLYSNVYIYSGKTLRITDELEFEPGYGITIATGGHLIVDGGVVRYGYINYAGNSDSSLKIQNKGLIIYPNNQNFVVPLGVKLEMNSGTIK